MTDREAMQQALDALRFALHVGFDESSESQIKKGSKAFQQHQFAVAALRERLAQPEDEPVVVMDAPLLLNGQPLYTRPKPATQWQGLTDDEIDDIYLGAGKNDLLRAREIEAKLKEKNT